jgi:hypothetical protein
LACRGTAAEDQEIVSYRVYRPFSVSIMNYLRIYKEKRFIYHIGLEAESPNSMVLALARTDLAVGAGGSHL